MRAKHKAILAATFAVSLAGCGESSERSLSTGDATPTAATPAKEAPKPATGKTIQSGSTQFGKILQDGRGRTIYLFTKEQSDRSQCFGDCAKAWPPVYSKGAPQASAGVRQAKLGTTRHGNKSQVTYNGHPLYYYVDEDEPGEVLCQGVSEFGGIWYVIDRRGDAIT